MIVTFNRESGNILSLGETFKNFNTKTMVIDEISHMKYVSIDKIDKISKLDKFGRECREYNGIETAVIQDIPIISKGFSLYKEGDIELFDNSSTGTNNLPIVQIYDEVGKYYSFPKDYKMFSIDEILELNYQSKLESSDCTFALGENFSYLKNILIHSSTFKSINKREVVLSPGDHLKLKSVDLENSSNIFKILDCNKDISIYINDLELETILEFKKPIDRINISFKNNTNKTLILDSILIGYSNIIS